MALSDTIKELAHAEGFDAIGITTADPFPEIEDVVVDRVRNGLMDGLPWFTEERARISARPRQLLPWARSIIALAISYYADGVVDATRPDEPHGQVARYAWGRDYHDVLRAKMRRLLDRIRASAGVPVEARFFVDTGRLTDRAAAQRAGLGWFGTSANLITRRHGTWVFLCEIVTDLELPPDLPIAGHCGACDRCIPACPTGAIVAPGVIDNQRCLSFQTIENRGSIPPALRPLLGNRIFGCDACQESCPHTWKLRPHAIPEFQPPSPESSSPALIPLLQLDDTAFRARFRGTPLTRPKRAGLLRNAAVALGNVGDPVAVPALAAALANDPDPLVRGHAAWALGRIGGRPARQTLESCRRRETDATVHEEIQAALEEHG